MVMLFPAPALVPPHDPVNHSVVAPVPINPPFATNVVESPSQIVVSPVILVGATDGWLTVNVVGLLVAVPEPVVTVTKPVVPVPITAVIWVLVKEVIEVTAVPPILTLAAVIPIKFVPLMTIEFPGQPLVESRLVIVGIEAVTLIT